MTRLLKRFDRFGSFIVLLIGVGLLMAGITQWRQRPLALMAGFVGAAIVVASILSWWKAATK